MADQGPRPVILSNGTVVPSMSQGIHHGPRLAPPLPANQPRMMPPMLTPLQPATPVRAAISIDQAVAQPVTPPKQLAPVPDQPITPTPATPVTPAPATPVTPAPATPVVQPITPAPATPAPAPAPAAPAPATPVPVVQPAIPPPQLVTPVTPATQLDAVAVSVVQPVEPAPAASPTQLTPNPSPMPQAGLGGGMGLVADAAVHHAPRQAFSEPLVTHPAAVLVPELSPSPLPAILTNPLPSLASEPTLTGLTPGLQANPSMPAPQNVQVSVQQPSQQQPRRNPFMSRAAAPQQSAPAQPSNLPATVPTYATMEPQYTSLPQVAHSVVGQLPVEQPPLHLMAGNSPAPASYMPASLAAGPMTEESKGAGIRITNPPSRGVMNLKSLPPGVNVGPPPGAISMGLAAGMSGPGPIAGQRQSGPAAETKAKNEPFSLSRYLRGQDPRYINSALSLLDNPDFAPFSAKFRLGTFPHIISGNPAVMAGRSSMIAENLQFILDAHQKGGAHHFAPKLAVNDKYNLCGKCDRYHDDGQISSFLHVWIYLNGIHSFGDVEGSPELGDDAIPYERLSHEIFLTLMAWFTFFWIDDQEPVFQAYYRNLLYRCLSFITAPGEVPKYAPLLTKVSADLKKKIEADAKGDLERSPESKASDYEQDTRWLLWNATQIVLLMGRADARTLQSTLKGTTVKDGVLRCPLYGEFTALFNGKDWVVNQPGGES